MFPKIESLPDAEVAARFADGDGDRVLGQDRPDVCGHVVGAFVVVAKERIAVGNQAREKRSRSRRTSGAAFSQRINEALV